MSQNEGASSAQFASFENAAVVDDWENIAGDQFQQMTNERLSLAEQAKQASAVEQQLMNEQQVDVEDTGLPASMINKPIKILKREPPLRNRKSESEIADEAALMKNLSLDQRKANYEKARERIFNAEHAEEQTKTIVEEQKKSPKKVSTNDVEASTSNEIMVETINHLSDVQMLSEQTPNRVRQPQQQRPVMPMQAPVWIPPHMQDSYPYPPHNYFPPNMNQPMYGMPPPNHQVMHLPPVDFTRPPPNFAPQTTQKFPTRNNYNP